MKIFILGWKWMNSGPQNVNRSYVEASRGKIDCLHSRNRWIYTLEALWHILTCDVFVLSGYERKYALKLIKLLHKKMVFLLHGYMRYEDEINNWGYPSDLMDENDRVMMASDKIIAVSENYSKWIAERYPQFKDKLTYVNNGVTISPRQKVAKEKNVIALSGGDRTIKANMYVCRAVEILRNQGLDIKIKLFGHIYNNDSDILQIPFIERMDQMKKEEYLDYLDKIPLFVVNSESEPFGLVVADAINCHCSLLMSRYIGASSIMKTTDKDIVSDNHDIKELADKIKYLLEHDNSDRLLSTVDPRKCSPEASCQRLVSICKSL